MPPLFGVVSVYITHKVFSENHSISHIKWEGSITLAYSIYFYGGLGAHGPTIQPHLWLLFWVFELAGREHERIGTNNGREFLVGHLIYYITVHGLKRAIRCIRFRVSLIAEEGLKYFRPSWVMKLTRIQ